MPTPTQYNYSSSGDTMNGVSDGPALKSEIEVSGIIIALDRIDTSGDDLVIVFKDVLSGSDKTALDVVVGNHGGVPLSSPTLVSIDGPKDSDGASISRNKATKSGFHYEPRCLDFFTSKYLSLYNRKHDGNLIADGTDIGDASLRFFDVSGDLLSFQGIGHESETDVQFQVRLDTECIRTEMDWQPTYDMDIIGGIMMVKSAPTTSAYMWIVVAPDIPEFMGGSVPHVAGGWNLSFFQSIDLIQIDGRGSKTILYDPVFNSNKFRTIVKHGIGESIGIQIVYEHFKL